MCNECRKLDDKIEHYRRISRSLIDKTTLKGIETLIARCVADKKELHPELRN